MNIFLAGSLGKQYAELKSPFILQTFYDLRKYNAAQQKEIIQSPIIFFLDSGAFTFMNSGKSVDWKQYVDEYISFINRYNIRYFFELDLDTIIGVEQTQKLTQYLESKTGKQCIPVFHACRGLARWREMCQKYSYVAIGASGLTPECRWIYNDKLLCSMVDIAHSYGAKIHGLGYTRLSNINDTKIPFDSVDSTSCLSGGRFATVYKFTGSRLISKSIKGRAKYYKVLDKHNIQEWIKMQWYKANLEVFNEK